MVTRQMHHCSVATAAIKSAKYCKYLLWFFSEICVNIVKGLTAQLSQSKNHAVYTDSLAIPHLKFEIQSKPKWMTSTTADLVLSKTGFKKWKLFFLDFLCMLKISRSRNMKQKMYEI